MMVTTAFEPIARATIESYGSEGHPLVVLPSDTEFQDPAVLRERARQAIRQIFGE
jgi:hypothetical protein